MRPPPDGGDRDGTNTTTKKIALVNNAGIVRERRWPAPSAVSVDTVRETYETNGFGVVAVTRAFLPLLREAPAARIVNVSSELG